MIDAFTLPDAEEEDIDIYDALGLNTPVSTDQAPTQAYDPLAAFMDDDDEEEEARPASKRVIIKAPAPMPARGKQLRRTVKEDTSDDDMDMQSEDEEEEAVK